MPRAAAWRMPCCYGNSTAVVPYPYRSGMEARELKGREGTLEFPFYAQTKKCKVILYRVIRIQ